MQFVKELEEEEREVMRDEDLVLIGHSAGGGLSQFLLSERLQSVGALVVVAGFPCFGG
jgi:pimeloyl-ACP methyl ester carboxylesterase